MDYTRETITKWFESYFGDVRRCQGDLTTVPHLKKYFTSDFQLMMYTSPSSPPPKVMSRDTLLLSFVHPGLHEDIEPHSYVVDLARMIVAVQF